MFERWYPLAVRFEGLKKAPELFVTSHRVFVICRGNNLFHILPVCGRKLPLDLMLNGLVARILSCVYLISFPHEASQWGDTYCRPFLELVNLCGMKRLIPEVDSSQKLDYNSFIDRSQSVECTTVYKFRHVFFKATPVYFSKQGNHSAFLCVDCCFDITIKNTASWSLIAGMTRVLIRRLSFLVTNKSKSFLPHVGLVRSVDL